MHVRARAGARVIGRQDKLIWCAQRQRGSCPDGSCPTLRAKGQSQPCPKRWCLQAARAQLNHNPGGRRKLCGMGGVPRHAAADGGRVGQVLIEVRGQLAREGRLRFGSWRAERGPPAAAVTRPAADSQRRADARAGCGAEHVLFELPRRAWASAPAGPWADAGERPGCLHPPLLGAAGRCTT